MTHQSYYTKIKILLCSLLFTISAQSQKQFIVYFTTNQHQLAPAQKQALQKWVTQNNQSKIIAIHGYTDTDGTNSHNDTLATKRVQTVYQLIKNNIKTRANCTTQSFGENHQQQIDKAQNRKVIIYYLEPNMLHLEDQICNPKTVTPISPKKIKFPNNIILTNPDNTTVQYPLDTLFMQSLNRAIKGDKIKIENLNFVLNTFAITNNSRAKLYEILLVMQQNPNLNIAIQGHVCCVKSDKQDLSTQRAKAIYKFLELNGISKSRMQYKGFGSTQPLYPLPEKNEQERSANRRVEIEITNN